MEMKAVCPLVNGGPRIHFRSSGSCNYESQIYVKSNRNSLSVRGKVHGCTLRNSEALN